MSTWNDYPIDYRAAEVAEILHAVRAGECAAVIGLSGSGKSNLMGFLAHRAATVLGVTAILVDCNRLPQPNAAAFYNLLLQRMGDTGPARDDPAQALSDLERALEQRAGEGLCLLLDRFDGLYNLAEFPLIASNLRAQRDAYKYRLTYVVAARRPLDAHNELAELFYGHTLWLGTLSLSDARWSARRDAARFSAGQAATNQELLHFDGGQTPRLLAVEAEYSPRETGQPAGQTTLTWDETVIETLVNLSRGYPSMLRGACEAYAAGVALEVEALRAHPAVSRRVAEFWADTPSPETLHLCRLEGNPLLGPQPAIPGKPAFDTTELTAKENLLLEYLMAHAGDVCEKDEIIRAVWPEDVIFEQGIRDESLAQLVRRLRVKIEPDPAELRYIHTVPGRGYRFTW